MSQVFSKILFILFILLIVFTIPGIDAWEFDNIITQVDNYKVVIKDSFLGIPTTKVGEVEIVNYKPYCFPDECYLYYNLSHHENGVAFKWTKYWDKYQTEELLGRESNYEVWIPTLPHEVDDYEYVCSMVDANETEIEICERINNGTKTEYGTWTTFSSMNSDISSGNYLIREKIDIAPGETIDLVPNFYGIDLDMWIDLTGLTLYEHYTPAMNDRLGTSDGNTQWAVTFQVGREQANETIDVGGISVGCSDNPSVSGTLVWEFQGVEPSTGKPNGTVLGNSTVQDSSTFCDVSWPVTAMRNATMQNNATLHKGMNYSLVLRWISYLGLDYGWGSTSGGANYYGDTWSSADNGSTWSAVGQDLNFGIYGLGISLSPTVTLNLPEEGIVTVNTTIDFNCSATDDQNVTNISLILDDVINITLVGNDTPLFLELNLSRTGLIDGSHNWSCMAWDNESNQGTASYRNFIIDLSAPFVNITYPTNIINYHKKNTNLTINWTVIDASLETCLLEYEKTNISVTCLDNNRSVNVTFYDNRSANFCANDTIGNLNCTSRTWNYNVFENNQTFSNETTEGNLEIYLANTVIGGGTSITIVEFIYNNTNYSAESFSFGNYTILRRQNFIVPKITADTLNIFYWDLTLANGLRINLTQQNQTVFNLNLDNCTSNSNQILNFTVYDEELQTKLDGNVTVETAVNIYSRDRSTLIINLSDSYNDNPTGICLNTILSNSSIYSLDTIVRYEHPLYANEYYNIVNFSLTSNSTTQDIKLYDLNLSDSTEFQLSFTGSNFLPVEDALVSVERQYISENVFKTVELPKTDFNGQTILHLVRNEIIYNIRIMKGGIILGNFENIVAFCEDFTIGDCKINLNAFDSVEGIFDTDSDLGITFTTPIYDNDTRIISFNFLSVDGTSKTISMNVTRNDIFGNRSVCNDLLVSAGGTLSCEVDSKIEDSSLAVLISVNGQETATKNISLDPENYGVGGYLVAFIMAISIIIMFSGSKTGVLIGIIISFVAAIGMNMLRGDLLGLGASGIWLLVIIILAIWKLNKEREQ